jgi:predicted amidophosphoribosyltransferase
MEWVIYFLIIVILLKVAGNLFTKTICPECKHKTNMAKTHCEYCQKELPKTLWNKRWRDFV